MNELGALVMAHIPALVMMIVGYVLLIVEMYIPGFGLAGISGTLLMIGGTVLMEPSPLQALILVLISVVLLGIAFSVAMHSFSKGRLSRSKLVLNAALENPQEVEGEDLRYFIGRTGQTRTALRPAGIAEFDGVKLNVVSDGDFVDAGRSVRVERVEGNRIVVRELDERGNPV